MERRLKERLTGAVVLILLAIIFIPMILDNSAQEDIGISKTNIPVAPVVDFKTKIQPIEELPTVVPPQMPMTTSTPESSTVTPVSTDTIVTGPASNSSGTPEILPVPEPASAAVSVPETAKPPEVVKEKSKPESVASPQQVTAVSEKTPEPSGVAWVIQLGSFASQENADSLVKRLQKHKFPAYIDKVKTDAGVVFKVRVGPKLSRAEAEKMQTDLKTTQNLDAIIVRYP